MARSDIAALLDRVRQATGPEWQIDSAVEELLSEWKNIGGHWLEHKITGEHKRTSYPPSSPITASLDAIVALIERELPGQAWTLGKNVHHHYWLATFNELVDGTPRSSASSHAAPTQALALCAAFLAKLSLSDHAQT